MQNVQSAYVCFYFKINCFLKAFTRLELTKLLVLRRDDQIHVAFYSRMFCYLYFQMSNQMCSEAYNLTKLDNISTKWLDCQL